MSSEESNGDWTAYADYNKILRTWFVAFGIGVPSTFLINKDLVKYISVQKGDPHIFIVFLIGATAQVLMAFINKIINWCAYYKKDQFPNREPKKSWEHIAYAISKASNWFVIDVVADLVTMFCFSWALIKLIELIKRSKYCYTLIFVYAILGA